MAANLSAQAAVSDPQFELKAGSFTLPLLRLLGADMDAVGRQLGEKVDQAAGFFQNAPVVIDLKEVAASGADVEFPLLVGLMRGYGMIPIGVRGGTPAQNAAAEAMELAVLSDRSPRRREVARRPAEPAPVKPTPRPQGTKVVDRPVR